MREREKLEKQKNIQCMLSILSVYNGKIPIFMASGDMERK